MRLWPLGLPEVTCTSIVHTWCRTNGFHVLCHWLCRAMTLRSPLRLHIRTTTTLAYTDKCNGTADEWHNKLYGPCEVDRGRSYFPQAGPERRGPCENCNYLSFISCGRHAPRLGPTTPQLLCLVSRFVRPANARLLCRVWPLP